MTSVFSLYRVRFKVNKDEPRVAYVEALSMTDALSRASRHYHLAAEGVELVDDGNYAVFIPVGDRERAEVEAEAARIGL